jgi:hypothetical protein
MGCYGITRSENIALPVISETVTFATLTKTAAHGLSTKTGIVDLKALTEYWWQELLSQKVMKTVSHLDF